VYHKMIEGVVTAVVPLLLKIRHPDEQSPTEEGYLHVVFGTVAAVLILPGVTEEAMYRKVQHAFRNVRKGFQHTKLAEERIVDALFA